jgi:hypothetical protein
VYPALIGSWPTCCSGTDRRSDEIFFTQEEMRRNATGHGVGHALALAAMVLLTTMACSARGRRQEENFPPVAVQVENQNFNDVTVYLVWNSDRRRLGVVNGNSRGSFSTQWHGPSMQVELDVLAGRRYRGDRISVNPGDNVVIEIPSTLERFRVYRRGP